GSREENSAATRIGRRGERLQLEGRSAVHRRAARVSTALRAAVPSVAAAARPAPAVFGGRHVLVAAVRARAHKERRAEENDVTHRCLASFKDRWPKKTSTAIPRRSPRAGSNRDSCSADPRSVDRQTRTCWRTA